MNITYKRLFGVFLTPTLASAFIIGTFPLNASVDYSAGDLVAGFHATGGTGSNETFTFNIGSSVAFRDQTAPTFVFNIGSQLSALYGPDWFDRTDLYWGIAGNRTNSPFGAPVDGDPRQTVYVSRAAMVPGGSTPWAGYGPALGTAATYIQGFLTGESGGFDSRPAAEGTDNRGAIVSTAFHNSWEEYNPQPGGAAFVVFAGGIEGSFGKGGTHGMLDVFRILATDVGADPSGPVGDGVLVATFTIDRHGNIEAVYPNEEPGPVSPRISWRERHGLPSDGTGQGADSASPSGDGIPNLLKYALDLDPNKSERSALPQAEEILINELRYLGLDVSKNPDANDVILVVEISRDLIEWSSDPADIIIITETNDRLLVRDIEPLNDEDRCFLRIRVIDTK